MKIEPFGERVAIKIVQPEEVTSGGLIMATSKNNSNRGLIVSVSNTPTEGLSVGDEIIFAQGAGVNYTDGNDDYKIISVKEILGKIIKGE